MPDRTDLRARRLFARFMTWFVSPVTRGEMFGITVAAAAFTAWAVTHG